MFSISTVRLFRQSIPNAIFAEKIWENRFSSALLFFSFILSLSVLFAVHGSIFVYHCYSPFSPITFSHWKEISLFVYLYGAWAFDFFPFYIAKVCVYYVCVWESLSKEREVIGKIEKCYRYPSYTYAYFMLYTSLHILFEYYFASDRERAFEI